MNEWPDFVWDMTSVETLRYLAMSGAPELWSNWLHRLADSIERHEPPVVL